MVGNRTLEVKPPHIIRHVTLAYTGVWPANPHSWPRIMVEPPIKPTAQPTAEDPRRAEQGRLYRRNQVFGLLIVAAVIVTWWLFHTNPRWIFPPGWWRP